MDSLLTAIFRQKSAFYSPEKAPRVFDLASYRPTSRPVDILPT
jgi:hypothetical protein